MKTTKTTKTTKKITVGILFGGKSTEHEISLLSAKNVVAALDKDQYSPLLIGIDKHGRWLVSADVHLLQQDNLKLEQIVAHNAVAFVPHGRGKIINVFDPKLTYAVDVVFPVLHGPFGEDGAIQGLLKVAEVPFVGASVLGSAVGMDKDVMRRLLRDARIPMAEFIVAENQEAERLSYNAVVKKLGSPFFVKPANAGSSVGISKVKNKHEFAAALKEALQYDFKVVIEEFIAGREFECAVLGNENPITTPPGEIISTHEFYSYTAKYLDENGAVLQMPANLPKAIGAKIQKLALKTFKVLSCEGLGRVDFFLRKDGSVLVNEINTIPGFTAISMYPKLWEIAGVNYTELVDRLIQLACGRFAKEQKLKTSYGDA